MQSSLPQIPSDDGLRAVSEIRDALGIAEYKSIAYAELTIDGETDELIAVSGYRSPFGTVPLFVRATYQTFDVGFDRSVDAEVKLLEVIAARLRQAPYSTAAIRLFSEHVPCDSCEGVIVQFRAEFPPPDVQLVVSDGGR